MSEDLKDKLLKLKKYLDSKIDVTDNPHDNIFLYKHHMWREHKIKVTEDNFFDKEFIDGYIKDMKKIGWKSPENRLKLIKSFSCSDVPKFFEGDNFEVDIHIDSDRYFASSYHFMTDYEGYQKLKALLNELSPPKETEEL